MNNTISADDVYFDGDYTNALVVADARAIAGGLPFMGNLPIKPADLYQIDQKSDDGFPATGFIRAPKFSGLMLGGIQLYCTTSTAITANYELGEHTITIGFPPATVTVDRALCAAIFMTGLKGN